MTPKCSAHEQSNGRQTSKHQTPNLKMDHTCLKNDFISELMIGFAPKCLLKILIVLSVTHFLMILPLFLLYIPLIHAVLYSQEQDLVILDFPHVIYHICNKYSFFAFFFHSVLYEKIQGETPENSIYMFLMAPFVHYIRNNDYSFGGYASFLCGPIKKSFFLFDAPCDPT